MKRILNLHRSKTLWVAAALCMTLAPVSATADDTAGDKELAKAIAHKLERIPSVNAARIQVSDDNGAITLSGTVGSIPEQNRAIDAAKSFRGVREVIDNIDVSPIDRADEAIQDDVRWTLSDDPFLGAEPIEVAVDDGSVTLKGKVDHWQKKRLAERLAEDVSGVSAIENNLEISYDTPRTEDEIRTQIARQLNETRNLRDNEIEIDVDGGRVELEGSVDTVMEEEKAVELAWVQGVTEVESDLDVEWTEETALATPMSDDEIQSVVESRIESQPMLAGADLDIDVDDRMVTLSGEVSSLLARDAATREARQVAGVRRVTNSIHVVGQMADAQDIHDAIHRAFNASASLADDDIGVRVEGNTVFLSGEVDNAEERQGAARIANRRVGVTEVVNNIDVPEWVRLSDAELKEAVESEYAWSVFVDGSDIDVDVDDGVVTLTGTVDDVDEFETAIENAYEAGAKDVVARMNLEDGSDISDAIRVQAKYSYKKD